jgi:hypothetical protein
MATEDIPPTTLKPAPVTVACEIVTADVPVLVSVKVCGLVEPETTFPKVRVAELAASVPEPDDAAFDVGEFAAVKPTQPASDITAKQVSRSVRRPSGAWCFGVTCDG